MGQNVYEGMFLMDCGKTRGNWDKATKTVRNILKRHQAEVVACRPWDERALVYPIKGQKRGMYLLTYFRADGSKVAKIGRDCNLNEAILRQLILKVNPKLVDQLVAQAVAPQPEQQEQAAEEPVSDVDAIDKELPGDEENGD